MQYKPIGRNREYRLTVPRLTGGLNVCTPPTQVADRELTQVCNMCQQDGVLTTRPGLRLKGDAPFTALPVSGETVLSETDIISSAPIEVDGEMCVVVVGGVAYEGNANTQFSVQLLTIDGEVKREYATGSLLSGGSIAVLPCDPIRYGSPFLLYKNNVVYKEVYENDIWRLSPLTQEELYAPLVMINAQSIPLKEADECGYRANGVMFEGFNMLSGCYRSQFTSVCESIDGADHYVLPTALEPNTIVSVHVMTDDGIDETITVGSGDAGESESKNITFANGSEYEVVVSQKGWVGFRPPLPASAVSGNVTITCVRASDKNTLNGGVRGATLATWFGGTQNKLGGTRAFLGGFTKDGAKICWSDVNNPLYFPENNYMYVGDLSQSITAFGKQGDMLVFFKKREMYYATYVQGEIDEVSVEQGTNVDVTAVQAYFPLTQLSPYIGCDCPHSMAVCQNRLVWMCSDGRLYTLASASPYSESNVREIGSKITPHIVGNTTKQQRLSASAADVDGQYMLFIGNRAYSFHYGDTGLSSLSSSDADDTVSDSIAWYYHQFDAVSEIGKPTLRIVSDGAYRALVIATYRHVGVYYTHVRFGYTFGGAEDRAGDAAVLLTTDDSGNLSATLVTTVTSAPIASSFTTKAFNFGDVAAFKRIKAVFLETKGDGVHVSLEADGQASLLPKAVASERMEAHRVWGVIGRCKTMAISVRSEGAMSVGGIRLHYTTFGTVK